MKKKRDHEAAVAVKFFDLAGLQPHGRKPLVRHGDRSGRKRHRRSVGQMRRSAPAHAIPLLHLLVPALYVRAIIRNLHLQSMTEIDHRDRGNVGNRKRVAGHKLTMRELFIELFMEPGNA